MYLQFKNKRISKILTVLPAKEVLFEDEMANYNFSIAKSLKLKSAMGYNKRRVAEIGTTSSDLCIYGLEYLFEKGYLKKEEIDALILVTQTPDYIIPPTSNIIQGYFSLKHDLLCMDINQGCAGYIIGLMQSFLMLEQETINKVVLLNADVLSPKVSKKDRNSNPLIGDAASVTVLEKTQTESDIVFSIKMNGEGAFALQIPAGGAKLPISQDTEILEEDTHGNFRSKNHLVMKGDEVFNFVQTEVPTLILDLLNKTLNNKDDIDYYMFHQPNKFMLQKLADKLGIVRSKMPSNIVEEFGNSSGVTVPLNITHNLSKVVANKDLKLCLSGFGVGLTWGATVIELYKDTYLNTVNYKH